jgi:hypothetical protein
MSTAVIATQSTAFRLGWWVLFGISVVSVLSYVVLIFVVPILSIRSSRGLRFLCTRHWSCSSPTATARDGPGSLPGSWSFPLSC